MDNSFSLLLVLILLGIAVVIFLLSRKKDGSSDANILSLMDKMTQQSEKLSQLALQNNELRQELDRKLSETHKITENQYGQSAAIMQSVTGQANKMMSDMHAQSQKVITEVSEKLAKLDETNKQVVNFSSQLKSLQDILKNPKQRGVMGEYFLEQTLKNVLPPKTYQMQYAFKNGEIVDAVVFVKDKIIPIDSKFSLENYEKVMNATDDETREKLERAFKQDLKNRIDETAKYVRPEEGTLEFAFMFIPSEAIYYDLLVGSVGAVKVNTRDLIEYAFRDKKVIIVSPTSFLAYLQTVLQGLRAMQIEDSAKEIKLNVEKLGKHLNSYNELLTKLGGSLGTTVSHYNNASQEFRKMDKDVLKISGGTSNLEILEIEKPKDN
jgi:DNA recombination protein RmuC